MCALRSAFDCGIDVIVVEIAVAIVAGLAVIIVVNIILEIALVPGSDSCRSWSHGVCAFEAETICSIDGTSAICEDGTSNNGGGVVVSCWHSLLLDCCCWCCCCC